MRTVSESFNTDGSGLWSNETREVKVVGLEVPYIDQVDGESFGELRVYFDTNTWDTTEHGLIYTDKAFLAELRDYLNRAGYCGDDVHYSEQGMQGDNYVSLDADTEFLKSWSGK